MKAFYEILTDDMMELEDWQVERALQKATIDAIRRARQFNTEFVISENGKVKCLRPDETEPHERAALKNLERLNRKIAELQNAESAALILNDEPTKKESPK